MVQIKKLKGASGLAAALLFICSQVAHSTSASHLQDAVRALRQPVAQSSLEDLHRAAFSGEQALIGQGASVRRPAVNVSGTFEPRSNVLPETSALSPISSEESVTGPSEPPAPTRSLPAKKLPWHKRLARAVAVQTGAFIGGVVGFAAGALAGAPLVVYFGEKVLGGIVGPVDQGLARGLTGILLVALVGQAIGIVGGILLGQWVKRKIK